jgi:hypothetical protein
MHTKIIEASNGPKNYGKFMLARMDVEWGAPSALPGYEGGGVVAARGWSRNHLWVLDLQTGEGALFLPGGHAKADLDKHAIWVCPLFEPFLTWLYKQDLTHIDELPAHVDLPDAPFEWAGYRRPGSTSEDGPTCPHGYEPGDHHWYTCAGPLRHRGDARPNP